MYLDSLAAASSSSMIRSSSVMPRTTTTTTTTSWSPNFESYSVASKDVTAAPKRRKPESTDNNAKAMSKPDDALESWLGQYNRNRVAQKLMEMGVTDEAAAHAAGEMVQEYALARTARRCVRTFLRQRDVDWANQDLPVFERVSNTTVLEYGFQDILNVFEEFGLSGTDVAAILTHTPSLAFMMPKRRHGNSSVTELNGETLEETLSRAYSNLLCGDFKLRKYDARKVLRSSPGLLTMRGSRNAAHVVSMLSKLGVSASSIARDKNSLPVLLSRSPAALFRLVAFLSSDAVRMPLDRIGPLLRRRECTDLLNAVAPVPPSLEGMQASAEDGINGNHDTVASAASWGIDSEERRERINYTYLRMSTTAWTLRHEIGSADLGKIVAAYPSVLLLDANDQILPAASYLMEELGIWKDDLARVLQLYPALLGVEVTDMRAIVEYMLSLGVAEESLASIFRSFPALLTLSLKNDMIPVVEFLRSIGLTNIGRFVTRLPPVLGYSIESELAPKWEVLKSLYAFPNFELSKFPAYFSYPLERVIKTRFEYLRKVKRIPIQLTALDVVVRFGDRDFAVKVAADKDGGAAFAEFAKKRASPKTSEGANSKKTRR